MKITNYEVVNEENKPKKIKFDVTITLPIEAVLTDNYKTVNQFKYVNTPILNDQMYGVVIDKNNFNTVYQKDYFYEKDNIPINRIPLSIKFYFLQTELAANKKLNEDSIRDFFDEFVEIYRNSTSKKKDQLFMIILLIDGEYFRGKFNDAIISYYKTLMKLFSEYDLYSESYKVASKLFQFYFRYTKYYYVRNTLIDHKEKISNINEFLNYVDSKIFSNEDDFIEWIKILSANNKNPKKKLFIKYAKEYYNHIVKTIHPLYIEYFLYYYLILFQPKIETRVDNVNICFYLKFNKDKIRGNGMYSPFSKDLNNITDTNLLHSHDVIYLSYLFNSPNSTIKNLYETCIKNLSYIPNDYTIEFYNVSKGYFGNNRPDYITNYNMLSKMISELMDKLGKLRNNVGSGSFYPLVKNLDNFYSKDKKVARYSNSNLLFSGVTLLDYSFSQIFELSKFLAKKGFLDDNKLLCFDTKNSFTSYNPFNNSSNYNFEIFNSYIDASRMILSLINFKDIDKETIKYLNDNNFNKNKLNEIPKIIRNEESFNDILTRIEFLAFNNEGGSATFMKDMDVFKDEYMIEKESYSINDIQEVKDILSKLFSQITNEDIYDEINRIINLNTRYIYNSLLGLNEVSLICETKSQIRKFNEELIQSANNLTSVDVYINNCGPIVVRDMLLNDEFNNSYSDYELNLRLINTKLLSERINGHLNGKNKISLFKDLKKLILRSMVTGDVPNNVYNIDNYKDGMRILNELILGGIN